ncbi:MAG: hypothetical protein H6Q11_922, partial [Acidobacteria bacterium]|nr:hypothetical protein [Acidobacteriota bacterium]
MPERRPRGRVGVRSPGPAVAREALRSGMGKGFSVVVVFQSIIEDSR